MSWTAEEEGRRWALDAAPRYAVERHGPYDYRMLIDGHEVDSAGLLETAFSSLATRAEYEEHGAELALARTRLRQARERLLDRYPRVARDGILSSILEGLGDALGVGPEAADPERASARDSDVWRTQLSPELRVVVEASLNVVLEVTTPAGRVVKRVLVGRGLGEALELAHQQAAIREADAEAARRRGPDEARRARGRLTKREAVDWLIGKGYGRGHAVRVADQLCRGGGSVLGMKYEAGYWVVPAEKA